MMDGFDEWYESEYEKGNVAPSACEAWQEQQKRIDELECKLKAINEYQSIILNELQINHNPSYELIFNKLEDIEGLSK